MSQDFSIRDAILFAFKRAAARPVHMAVFLICAVALSFGVVALIAIHIVAPAMEGVTQPAQGFDVGGFFLVWLGMMGTYLVLAAILGAGLFRILLRESPRLLPPIGFGADELRLIGVFICLFIVAIPIGLLMGILMIPLSLIVMPVAALLQSSLGMAGMVIALLPVQLVALVIGSYVFGRIGLAVPLTIRDRAFNFRGWEESRDFGWPLAWAYIIVTVLMSAAVFALQFAMMGGMQAVVANMNQSGFTMETGELFRLYLEPEVALLMLSNLFVQALGYFASAGVSAYAVLPRETSAPSGDETP